MPIYMLVGRRLRANIVHVRRDGGIALIAALLISLLIGFRRRYWWCWRDEKRLGAVSATAVNVYPMAFLRELYI